jgi:hypothetical protein
VHIQSRPNVNAFVCLVENDLLMIGRMCREGQTAKCFYAVIIADRKFRGDQAAFDIKDERAKEDGEMIRLFHREDFPVFEIINLYQRPAAEFQQQISQDYLAHVDKIMAEHKQREEQLQKEHQGRISHPKKDSLKFGESGSMPVVIS